MAAYTALLTYEGILTLSSEVSLFWRRRWTGATALFLVTKYMMLLDYNVLGAITFAPLSDQVSGTYILRELMQPVTPSATLASCAAMLKAQAMVSCLIYLPWAVFSALRVLALSGMNWFLAVLTFALSVVPTAMNLWSYSEGLSATTILNLGCQGVWNETGVEAKRWVSVPLPRSSLPVIALFARLTAL
ncbi:hypothetical protein BD413DRAFT_482167 [Trametes elegans]|nr:hypothetical protein BD413DRAFT_482167 [Trametes elegans]